MTFIDIVILVCSIGIVGSVTYIKIKNRKKNKCGGGCGSCSYSDSCKEVRKSYGEKKID
jgi:hypothetical protein